MQPHQYDERFTRMLWWSVPCPKCILGLSAASFGSNIPSLYHVGFGYWATSRQPHVPWPLFAMSFLLPLSSFPSGFLYSLHPMLGNHLPQSCYWHEHTAWQRLFHQGTRLWILTASHGWHLPQRTSWPLVGYYVVSWRICLVPHWRDHRTLSAFPLVGATSQLCPVSKMYC